MGSTIDRWPERSTPKGNLWLYPRHCRDDEEYGALQSYRGQQSGEARRWRNRDRNRLIVRYRLALGMKIFAVARHCRVSVATVWRVCRAALGETEARKHPTVPDVLRRLYQGLPVPRHTLYANRLTMRKAQKDRRLARSIQAGTVTVTDHCPGCGLRHRQLHEMPWCASCGLRLRYPSITRQQENARC